MPVWLLRETPGSARTMDCNRSGVTVYEKSGAPAVWTLDGILSCSTAPGIGFATVASAGAGAAGAAVLGAGAAVLGAGAAPCDTLEAGAGRAGGATGVVAMTWISGSFVELELPLEFEESCAAMVLGAIASTAVSAQGNPRSAARMTDILVWSAVPATLPMCLTTPRN